MRRSGLAGVVAILLGLVLVQPAATAPATSASLQFSLKLGVILGDDTCPDGTPAVAHCVGQAGTVSVKGLGSVHVHGVHVVDPSDQTCPKGTMTGELVTVHGTLLLHGSAPQCVNVTFGYGNYPVTISGSDGFASVTGSGLVANGAGSYIVTGTITAPSALFDVDAPILTGVANRTVRSSSGHGVRVKFAVKAHDDVDRAVPVTCKPRSGSLFRVGRSRVTCTATDTSANTATRSFTVTVRAA
jgi:hypothetical protein